MELERALEILGINKSAKEDDVKRAYRELVKKYHPDRNDTESSQKRIRQINQAFQTVMKLKFGKIDVLQDYSIWWWQQYGNDPIWGDYKKDSDN